MTTTPTPPMTGIDSGATEQAAAGKSRGNAGKIIVRLALLALCLAWVVPTIGLLVTSARERGVVANSGWWTSFASPLDFTQWTMQNYDEVITGQGMGNAFVNSLAVSVPATVIPILIAAFAAYSFTFMNFPGRDIFFIVLVGLLVVPLQVAFIPLLQIYKEVGLVGTFPAVWLAHAAFGMPLAVYILRNYMEGLPREVIESAKVDGASHFTTFWRLIIPMSTPALAAYAIFQFLWVWNDLLVALIFLGPGENEVVTINLSTMIGTLGADWHLLTAAAFVTMLVPLIVFLSLQRFFVRGLTAGSVKG
ncbi:MAG: carbohydrate ABC transporter permease [Haloechinothrix sp.]